MSAVERLAERFLLAGTVSEVEDVTPSMRRIQLTGPALRDLDWRPGQHVRVQVGELDWRNGFRDALRCYSVWRYHRLGSLELCVFDHPGAGPGARWSRRVAVGQRVAVSRPDGRLVVRATAPYHVFLGDATAGVPFGAMLRALPASARVFGAITADPTARLPVPRAGELCWLAPGEPWPALKLPAGVGVAYVAGEARACQAARQWLRAAHGWPRDAVLVKPFWAPGRRGLD